MAKSDDKLRAEWFWCDRWARSTARLLPIDARGLYREMLTVAWSHGGALPNNPDAIQRAVGVTPAEWKQLWPQIARYWRVDGETLVNETQQEVYAEAKRRQQESSDHAAKAAAARWGKAQGQPEQMPEHHHRHQPGQPREHQPDKSAGTTGAVPEVVPGVCPPSLISTEQEQKKDAPTPRRAVSDLKVPPWKTALAIAHLVIRTFPNEREEWTADFKAKCLEQGWNYAHQTTPHEQPLYVRALEAAAHSHTQRAERAARPSKPAPRSHQPGGRR